MLDTFYTPLLKTLKSNFVGCSWLLLKGCLGGNLQLHLSFIFLVEVSTQPQVLLINKCVLLSHCQTYVVAYRISSWGKVEDDRSKSFKQWFIPYLNLLNKYKIIHLLEQKLWAYFSENWIVWVWHLKAGKEMVFGSTSNYQLTLKLTTVLWFIDLRFLWRQRLYYDWLRQIICSEACSPIETNWN